MISIFSGKKVFDKNTVFDKLSLGLSRGKYYTLTGPNGSGKSTLISCFIQHISLDEGKILLENKSLDENPKDYGRKVFGLNDSIGWLPGMTVGQHLEMLKKNFLSAYKEQERSTVSVKEALEELGIAQTYDREPHTLSSGQEQRARLSSLLLRPATYYFLDEPEKRLDREGISWIMRWIEDRVEDDCMVCIATHDENLARGSNRITFPLKGESDSEK